MDRHEIAGTGDGAGEDDPPSRNPALRAVAVRIADPRWRRAFARPAGRLRAAARAAMAAAGAHPRATVSLLLTDDAEQQVLNARFRGKDTPTNVLSFPAPPGSPGPIGDISLAYDTLAGEAAAQGKTLEAHAVHLTVHGVLHCLGHDHMAAADAARMERLETRILAALGIADPYAPRDGARAA